MFPLNRTVFKVPPWPAGSYEVSTNMTVIAGVHVPANQLLTICMIGGGGGGSLFSGSEYASAPGGFAGAIINNTVTLASNENVACTIGVGGARNYVSSSAGNVGSSSIFGAYFTASGGAGAQAPGSSNYHGNGASRVSCYGTAYDGLTTASITTAYGGQAGFGNGGNGSHSNASDGSKGAGGGGCSASSGGSGGAGGAGRILISWS